MSSVSAVLIALNEANRIESCLRSLTSLDEIIVVDGGSTDQTLEVASRYTPKVFRRTFDNFSNQKNYGIEQAEGDWILCVDADEVVTPKLRDSLREVAQGNSEFSGFYLRRKNFLFGKELRFGGQENEKILRFFRRGRARFEQPIHEKLMVQGKIGNLSGELLHFSSSSVAEYFRKLNLYTDFEARWLSEGGLRPTGYHVWVKPFLRFLYYYFLRLGFLDGWEGFLYHSLSSFYLFFKYARLLENCDLKMPAPRP